MISTLIEIEEDCIRVKGPLHFANVGDLFFQGCKILKKFPQIKVDLQNVTTSNSAGIALLIGWLNQARKNHQSISFINLPIKMQNLAHICNLDKILTDESLCNQKPSNY